MINDNSDANTTHSCLMNIHFTYPQFCRLSDSFLPQLSKRTLDPWTFTKAVFWFKNIFSLCLFTGKVARSICTKLYDVGRFSSLISKFFYVKLLFKPHVARHSKWISFFDFIHNFYASFVSAHITLTFSPPKAFISFLAKTLPPLHARRFN